jgi:D-alanyl-D-alanine carboxypeptidase/D-alanyl-D-alanine-endopeptidase (penicillin-binding protein 4)
MILAGCASVDSTPNFGLASKQLKDGQEGSRHNSNKLFTPASTLKLFTAYAALSYLQPDFVYSTEVRGDKGKIKAGILKDNLYIKFVGDPVLVSEDIEGLITQLKIHHINKINSDIVIDDTIFDRTYLGPGWLWDDNNFCYSAPISAIAINRNCFELALPLPTTIPHIKLDNQLEEGNNCKQELISNQLNEYALTGCINEPTKWDIAYQNPRKYAQDLITSLLHKHHVKFNHIRFDQTPRGLDLIAAHKSPSLKKLVKIMLKESDNLIAENLLKTIGAAYYKTQGNFTNGAMAIKEILAKEAKLDTSKIRLVDGSGLSRYNLISPDTYITLFTAIDKNPMIKQEIWDSLPIAGVDGTLKDRITNKKLQGKVRAKTGGMSGITALVGYVESDNQGLIAFAIMLNGFVESPNSLYKFYEDILWKLKTGKRF